MKRGALKHVPTSASEWAVRLHAGALPSHEQEAFARWLDGNDDKLREIDEARAVLRLSSALSDSEIARAHLNESLRAIDFILQSGTTPGFPGRRFNRRRGPIGVSKQQRGRS